MNQERQERIEVAAHALALNWATDMNKWNAILQDATRVVDALFPADREPDYSLIAEGYHVVDEDERW